MGTLLTSQITGATNHRISEFCNLTKINSSFAEENQALFFSFLSIYFLFFLSVATDIKDEEVRIPKRLFLGMYLLCLS